VSLENYGKYQLIKKLATGGMAQIYLARQSGIEGFEKLLVVKRILPHLAENEDFIKMFLDEARIAARLNHPNIVQIFDLGAQDDSFFIAMEYIHGEDVRRVWKRTEAAKRELPVPLTLRIIMEACAGLDYAHKKTDQAGKPLGIVHRDISPQNILVTFEGGVKVVDFGIAKAADQATVTRSGVLKGKYSYMSPEQASGKKVDHRTDLFALGVVLYELLTGTRLFKRSSDIQTLNAVTDCEVAPPSQVNSRVPTSLDPVVLKALAKHPDDRYADAGGLQAALEDWLLQNQLPSSSVHLSAFLHEIYADRLAKEAEEGRVLIEDLDRAGNTDEAPPPRAATSSRSNPPRPPRQTASFRPPVDHSKSTEETRAQRPTKSGVSSPSASQNLSRRSLDARLEDLDPQVSVTRAEKEKGGGKGRLLVVLGLVVAGLVGAVAFWFALRAHPGAPISVTSEPSGAIVILDGVPLEKCLTPCDLPALATGMHEIKLSKPGFNESSQPLLVPEGKERITRPFRLEPVRAAAPGGGSAAVEPPAVDAGPPAPVLVDFEVRSVPAGAELWLGAKRAGVTPITVQVDPAEPTKGSLSRTGYKELPVTLDVRDGSSQTFTLEKDRHGGSQTRPPVPTDAAPRKEFGTVRFVVQPWATVTCNALKLGDTPFPDQRLPAGTYECTFVNADLAQSRKETVVVKPNEMVKVAVKF